MLFPPPLVAMVVAHMEFLMMPLGSEVRGCGERAWRRVAER